MLFIYASISLLYFQEKGNMVYHSQFYKRLVPIFLSKLIGSVSERAKSVTGALIRAQMGIDLMFAFFGFSS